MTQQDILQLRSVELNRTVESNLSARGLHHRSLDQFTKDVKSRTMDIQNAVLQGVRDPKRKSNSYLKSEYFHRALGFERLGQIENAIEDYGRCILLDDKCAAAHFNRGGLFSSQGKLDEAIEDLSKAIAIQPSNKTYLTNRSLLYRRKGLFEEATKDMVTMKSLERTTQAPTSKASKKASLDHPSNASRMERQSSRFNLGKQETKKMGSRDMMRSSSNLGSKLRHQRSSRFRVDSGEDEDAKDPAMEYVQVAPKTDDPMINYLKKSYIEREEATSERRTVVDFLKGVKFFSAIASDQVVMKTVAEKVKLCTFAKDDYIFKEGDPGKSFFIVADGEVSVVKCFSSDPGEKGVEELLVKLYRGQTFGETALDNAAGKRTAGAKASQPTYLLSLDVSDYKRIFASYKVQLKNEVRELLSTSAAFSNWEKESIDKLASSATIQSFGGGHTLVEAGSPVSTLYIIKCGVIKLLKDVAAPDVNNIQISEFFTPDTHDVGGMENPGIWVLKKNWKDHVISSSDLESRDNLKPFTVGVLGSGQVLGELAVLSPGSPSPTTAVTFTNVEVFKFESDLLLSLGAKFNSATVNVLNESLNLYNPPDEKIGHYYRSKYSWETRKRKILKSLVKDRPSLSGRFHELDH